jgi:type I restriction-modification system DNA methylase subunit
LAAGVALEQLDTHELATTIQKHASESRNEEQLKIRVEVTLRPILDKWGIQWASYEHRHEISGRQDALYGRVIIEYKSPGKLYSKSEFKKAKEQVKEYISKQAVHEKEYGRYFGVIIDGYKISFLRYRKNAWEEQQDPLEVNAQTVLRVLEAISGLRRKPLDAEFLLRDFGPKSEISNKVILTLYNSLVDRNSVRTDMLFNDWKRVFSQVCSYSKDKLTGLADYYGLDKKVDLEKLLFAIHTYYTILMKLLTSEIVTLFADSLLGSYLKRVEEAYYRSHEEMLHELKDLEEGGIFATVGMRNFLEADYFAWYLDEWNEGIAKSFFELTERLLDYEPATVELNPERVKDLFKRLYQNLVPGKSAAGGRKELDIRGKLGEFYTPDWLAELLLDEVGYDGNPEKRVLDPACGSGTFLVLAIKRIREYADEHFIDRRTLISKIIRNVRGIDLNPLAILASKANYLIALSDLIRYRPREGIEIPIYLADSISVVRSVTPYGEDEFELHTNEGKFWITKEAIDKNSLYPILSIITEGLKIGWTKEQFENALSKDIPLSQQSIKSFIRLYDKILRLEHYGKNRIWTSLLKNSFSPMLIGKFDYVIGNPPWINWENLPEFYRNSTKDLWNNYGLLEKTKGGGLGKVKRDIAMLFVARCFEQYLNNDGKLAFLIPFTTYKTQAGAGFRKWLATKCRVETIHDLVELYPFEGAINRTSLILLSQGKTDFPVPCVLWHSSAGSGIPQDADLEVVKKNTATFDLVFVPIEEGSFTSPWMQIGKTAHKGIRKVLGESPWYEAHEGVNTALNGVYWIQILSKEPSGLLITNPPLPGQKKKIRQVRRIVDENYVYPFIRGRDVKRWYTVEDYGWIILPHDTKTGKPSEIDFLKVNYPKTYSYFNEFKIALEDRSLHKLWGKGSPFYAVYGIGDYTFYPYKVVWKRVSGKISGKAEFACAVMEEVHDKFLGQKPTVPYEKLMLVSFKEEREAYYLAAVLNSSIIQAVVAAYLIETTISDITKRIRVPEFDRDNPVHMKLSELSKKAHVLAKKYYEENDETAEKELSEVEEEIDRTVARLYKITEKELEEIRKALKILIQGRVQEKEEAEQLEPD